MAGFTLIARPVVILALAGMGATQLLGAVDTGHDLVEVFARARVGEPLRAVAIGGSITQAGEGWIGGWLRDQFPCNAVTMYNAGMSATGSDLAVFRLERDVISCQPDFSVLQIQRMEEVSALVWAKLEQVSSSDAIRLNFDFIVV